MPDHEVKRSIRLAIAAAVMALTAAAAVHRGYAQVPKEFRNLQVLPKDITRSELVRRMRDLATDLGVGCVHCHVGPPNLQGMDFASDDKRTKRVARTMLKMVDDINRNYVAQIPAGDAPRQPVTCATCHRRATKPTRPLYDLLFETAVTGGATAALQQYQKFRDEYFGSGLYDFREHTLNIVGNNLREERQMIAEAYAMFKRNAELFPQSANAQFAAGQAAEQRGDLAAAKTYYQKALSISPAHAGAQRALATIK